MLLESKKKQKSDVKLRQVIQFKTDIKYKHTLLHRQLERYKTQKQKQKINANLSKVVIQEKNKVLKHVSEVERLKLDNLNLKAEIH